MATILDAADKIEAVGHEFDPMVHEISLMRQIILERVHALDLSRELVSNAAAREVGATEIKIKYTVDDAGHIFEVSDNGCGIDYTGATSAPGRLDGFFGPGLSSIVGVKGDEFSWKGLGSKLAYHSQRIELIPRVPTAKRTGPRSTSHYRATSEAEAQNLSLQGGVGSPYWNFDSRHRASATPS